MPNRGDEFVIRASLTRKLLPGKFSLAEATEATCFVNAHAKFKLPRIKR
jgi:hypothetical protein